MRLVEYLDAIGRSPFAAWFDSLTAPAAVKISVALERIELGNLSNAKSVGKGVMEYRVDFGPGYRIYFGRSGKEMVILLAGGSKRRQQADIAVAQARWADYKQRNKTGGK
jgi:putative addiction module killer protein